MLLLHFFLIYFKKTTAKKNDFETLIKRNDCLRLGKKSHRLLRPLVSYLFDCFDSTKVLVSLLIKLNLL